ncbi:hypothetical protein ETU09_06305 [Apibacter muscae]|uniref:Uncharacterized protein n=1 Tax=Apibacter muscae TaxID=2509004 RepID=A0A563DCP1_9FLAO|nr:hypothetical protein [Apibacter muscae]TWP27703.1 hypothetical protein ETU09_06305 [Apibacter muscae]
MLEFLGELIGGIIIEGLGAGVRYLFFLLIGKRKKFPKLLEFDGYNTIVSIITYVVIFFIFYLANL